MLKNCVLIIKKNGFSFGFRPEICRSCQGKCCQGAPGYVWVSEDEINAIAEWLKIPVEQFFYQYIIKVFDLFSFKEVENKDSFECIFFNNKNSQCTIYDVRPKQCRTFPFWEYFKKNSKEAFEECPGVVNV